MNSPILWFDAALAAALAGVTLTQIGLVWWFWTICGRPPAAPLPPESLPAARVILCLRGADPFLRATLDALVNQDHPDYEVVIVVDASTDPSWAIVHAFLDETETRCPVTVTPLRTRPEQCSLKAASLLQGLEALSPTIRTVALLDADVVPPAHWLRTLASELSDTTWAVTGNRWYCPPDHGLGSWTRVSWNAGALVQMVCFGIPWGGTLGLHRDLVDHPLLRQTWATAFCEDTSLPRVLRTLGKRCRFVPALVAINREAVSLDSLLPWISRQLLTARLYHPAWHLVFPFGLAAPTLVGLASLAAGFAVATGRPAAAALHLGGIAAFLLSLPLLVWWIERAARRGAGAAFRAGDRRVSHSWLRLLTGIAVAQATYPRCLWEAQTMQQCCWRGVRYAIAPGPTIRVLSDDAQPDAAAADQATRTNHSL